jgi:hypothetical protein
MQLTAPFTQVAAPSQFVVTLLALSHAAVPPVLRYSASLLNKLLLFCCRVVFALFASQPHAPGTRICLYP